MSENSDSYNTTLKCLPTQVLEKVTRSLSYHGWPECGITPYGVVYDLNSGKRISISSRNSVRLHKPNGKVVSMKVSNLVAWAWWGDRESIWRLSPYAENIRTAREFNLIPANNKHIIEFAENFYGGYYWVDRYGDIWCDHPMLKLSPPINDQGYRHCSLGSFSNVKVHRLVATYFCEIPKELKDIPLEKLFVNHKDGNKLNNNWFNLEWCTPHQNALHASQTGLLSVKISNEQLRKIWQMLQDDFTNREISEMTGIPEPTIGSIRQGTEPRYRTNEFTWRLGSRTQPRGTNRRKHDG